MTRTNDLLLLIAKMQRRLSTKRPEQWDLVNVLPPEDVDFRPYFVNTIPLELDEKPTGQRRDIANQKELLNWHRRGQKEIFALHMLLISYLRRESKYTNQAKRMFFRLWEEYADELVEILPLRDMTSALRTFADHADDTQRRLSAKLAFIYISLIRAYESERSAENLSPSKGEYQLPIKGRPLAIDRLRSIPFGKDDSLEIINLMMAEETLNDEITGPLILAILEAVRSGKSVFSRTDQARLDAQMDLDVDMFWSFGFDPASDEDTQTEELSRGTG